MPAKYRNQILEAIEGLRIRKTRPDGPRIASYCAKKYGYKIAEVKADLERLVDDDAVLKVCGNQLVLMPKRPVITFSVAL